MPNSVLVPFKDTRLPTSFQPAATQAKVAADEARIKFFRSKKLLPELEAAVDGLMAEQALFVTWWDGAVGVRQSPGGADGGASRAVLRSTLSLAAAEDMTGITHQTVSRWRKRLAKPDKYRHSLLGALALTAEANHRAVGTGDNHWFTPAEYVELARDALGGIDLDPASHPVAQEWIKAGDYFTEDDDALTRSWRGQVWLNPPYSRGLIDAFAEKMIAEYQAGDVTAAVMLTHSYTDTVWFQSLADAADAICFTRSRIKFIDADDTSANPTQGQAFFYFGNDVDRFAASFASVGFVMVPYRPRP